MSRWLQLHAQSNPHRQGLDAAAQRCIPQGRPTLHRLPSSDAGRIIVIQNKTLSFSSKNCIIFHSNNVFNVKKNIKKSFKSATFENFYNLIFFFVSIASICYFSGNGRSEATGSGAPNVGTGVGDCVQHPAQNQGDHLLHARLGCVWCEFNNHNRISKKKTEWKVKGKNS